MKGESGVYGLQGGGERCVYVRTDMKGESGVYGL